jgi:hypothetical protein
VVDIDEFHPLLNLKGGLILHQFLEGLFQLKLSHSIESIGVSFLKYLDWVQLFVSPYNTQVIDTFGCLLNLLLLIGFELYVSHKRVNDLLGSGTAVGGVKGFEHDHGLVVGESHCFKF